MVARGGYYIICSLPFPSPSSILRGMTSFLGREAMAKKASERASLNRRSRWNAIKGTAVAGSTDGRIPFAFGLGVSACVAPSNSNIQFVNTRWNGRGRRRSVVSPMHFRISAYLQNRTCLQGTPLTFPPQVLHALHCNFRRHTARLCIYIPLQSTARRPQHFCKFINRPCSFRVAGADAAIVSSSCPSLSRRLMRVECSQLIPPTTRTHVFFESVDAMGWDDDSECEVAANPLHVNILLTHTRI